MILNYDSSRIYEIYETQQTGKKCKIGEIENHVFYDVNNKGKRLEYKYRFNNNPEFWNQFKNISVKKISSPLGGFEPVVWGSYWTLSVLVTIFFVLVNSSIENQLFWIVISAIHIGFTIKFRYNTILVYWMTAISVFILLFLFLSGGERNQSD